MPKDEIDDDLLLGLKQAKTKRCYFAVVMKGSADGLLIVGKMKIKPADITDAKKKSGGTAVVRGACFFEDGKHVFESAKQPPATLAKLIKLLAKRDAGLMINPVCRVGSDPDLAEEGEGGDEAAAATAAAAKTAKTPPAAPPPQKAAAKRPAAKPQVDQAVAAWQMRSTALSGPLKQVLQRKLGDTAAIAQKFKEAAGFAQEKRYASALNALEEVERMVKSALADAPSDQVDDDGEAADASSTQVDDADAAAAWKDRIAGLKDSLRLVGKSPDLPAIRKHVEQGLKLVAAKNYDQAHAAMDQADELIVAAQKKARQADTASTTKDGTVAFRKSMVIWDQTVKSVRAEVARLQGELKSRYPDQASLAGELNVVVQDFEGQLEDVLKDAVNAPTDDARQPLRAEALRIIRDFQGKATANELIGILDKCPFTRVSIEQKLTAALGQLQGQLSV